MKFSCLLIAIGISINVMAQRKPVPHGMTYGARPDMTEIISASRLESFMGKRARISATVSGKIMSVTKTHGGWFTVDAGKGRMITAHFKNYRVNIPASLRGKEVIMDGIAEKQFAADDLQHYAGKQSAKHKKVSPAEKLIFEVHGLMVMR